MKSKKLIIMVALFPLIAGVTSCSENPSPDNQRKFHDKEETITMTQVIKDGEKQGYPAPSTGDTKVFVVPVQFTDYKAEDIGKLYNSEIDSNAKTALKHFKEDGITPAGGGRGAENAREDIRKAYFGDEEDTTWHSLKSYYKSSSYGKLNFNGLVANWIYAFTNPETYKPVSAKEFKDMKCTADILAQYLLSYYSDDGMAKYNEFKNEDGSPMFNSGTEFLKYFDSNSDGCFDVIEMVYSAPYYATYENTDGKDVAIDNDMFWAYCGGTGTNGNKEKPKLSKWAFQSYYTTVEGGVRDGNNWRPWTCEEISTGVAKVDAHTIVHETGHALGLPDYYDYDYKRSPACGVDMMDHNVGDHNSYSKSLYGWTDPIVVTGPTEVSVRSFTDTGDCIMVPYRGYWKDNEKYGNTFFTEYLAIELYTPTGVNKADSEHPYQNAYPLCPSDVGIKVYHIDSRIGIYDYKTSRTFVGYTDSIVNTESAQYVMRANSNTLSETIKTKVNGKERVNWLLEYLGKDDKASASVVANDNLFKEGDTFGYDTYSGYQFNSGKSFGYKFEINSLSAEGATITFYQA